MPVAAGGIDSALDLEMLRRMQKTHPTLVGRLLGHVSELCAEGDPADAAPPSVRRTSRQLKMTAHSLKSSSANIGAMQLSGLCRELEARLKSATEWDADANLARDVEAIESAYARAEAALTKLKAELPAAGAGKGRRA